MRYLLLLSLLFTAPLLRAQHRFEAEIAAFESADKATPPPARPILFTGSSSVRFWTTLAQDFPNKPVLNRGFGGSELSDVRHFADRLIVAYHPRQIVLYAGENDIAAGQSAGQTLARFTELFTYVRQQLPRVPFTFISIKRSPSRRQYWPVVDEANQLIRQYLATQKRARFVDIGPAMLDASGQLQGSLFKSDSLHMTPAGYDRWVPVLRPYLR